jgi:hypothetical protein
VTATIDTSIIEHQSDVASIEEGIGNSDIVVDGILTNYLIGVAATGERKDLMITRLDVDGGIEAYAVLPEIRWEWGSAGEEAGNTDFGTSFFN